MDEYSDGNEATPVQPAEEAVTEQQEPVIEAIVEAVEVESHAVEEENIWKNKYEALEVEHGESQRQKSQLQQEIDEFKAKYQQLQDSENAAYDLMQQDINRLHH